MRTVLARARFLAAPAVSPAGDLIATVARSLVVLDAKTGTQVAEFEGPLGGSIRCLTFSPDGSVLVAGLSDTTALVFPVR